MYNGVNFKVESYATETGESIGSTQETPDFIEAKKLQRSTQQMNKTVIIDIEDSDVVVKNRDSRIDAQNDTYWSSYDVLN
jgi:hypothetical protein